MAVDRPKSCGPRRRNCARIAPGCLRTLRGRVSEAQRRVLLVSRVGGRGEDPIGSRRIVSSEIGPVAYYGRMTGENRPSSVFAQSLGPVFAVPQMSKAHDIGVKGHTLDPALIISAAVLSPALIIAK